MYYREIRSFSEVNWSDFESDLYSSLKREIESENDNYILNINEDEYIGHLVEKYTLQPLSIDLDSEEVQDPTPYRIDLSNNHYSSAIYGRYKEGYRFTISYTFEGDAQLFRVRPSTYTLTSNDIKVDNRNRRVSFQIEVYNQNVDEFNREKQSAYGRAFVNMDHLNVSVCTYNSDLRKRITTLFKDIKSKRLSKNNFFSAIKVKKSSSSPSSYAVPVLERKIPAKPKCPTEKAYTLEPSIDKSSYESIIQEILQLGRSMEQKPSLYIGKNEEGLRDMFVTLLETRFQSTTVTGETFNHGGKTDILLKHTDGSNVFVAECKIWHGQQHFKDAISQLFDRYLTWRDTKAALLLFVTGVNLSSVLETIKQHISSHPYFKRSNGNHGETSLSYIFGLPQDHQKDVYLEVIAFNFDKLKSCDT